VNDANLATPINACPRQTVPWPVSWHVLHSNSRLPGGSFTVQAGRDAGGRLRIEVSDQGGPWDPSPDPGGQHGRGLLIVARLAADWGITGHLGSRTAWLELDWP
jgi:hypothetical protein